ncbi:MAG: electron transfer flavoprotein alpha subunit [Bacillota bacterium]|nr:electron transfer flavoprotein alpha subunit [Bacillota bacterium]
MAEEEIWVFAEQRDGRLQRVALELVGKARAMAGGSRPVVAVLLGSGVEGLAGDLFAAGAEEVLLADHPALKFYRTQPYADVLVPVLQERQPDIVLFGATALGRDLAPRLAARLGTGLTADCLDLALDPQGLLVQTKPSYGGNVLVHITIPRHRPQMTTVRPRVFPLPPLERARQGKLTRLTVDLVEDQISLKVLEVVPLPQPAVRLEDAAVVVAGGRGMGSKENFQLLEELARVLGGVVGATRPPVDEGWIGADRQIGQSGKTVAPRLYIACGLSGVVQHTVGMQKADVVVAINKDPHAPIFDLATYGIVGDVKDILPALTARFREFKAKGA